MIYILTATKSEAQAFVEFFALKNLQNTTLKLIISGVGVTNMQRACRELLELHMPKESDIFLNIGICGAPKSYTLGDVVAIKQLFYKEQTITLTTGSDSLRTLDYPQRVPLEMPCDMEAFGFSESLRDFSNLFVYKVVSDHFEPNSITKDMTKKLIKRAIPKVLLDVTH